MAKKPEHVFSHYVNELFERVLCPPVWFTAVETGTWIEGETPQRRFAAEAARRYQGIKPHALDWYVFQLEKNVVEPVLGRIHDTAPPGCLTWFGPNGRYMQIELKVGKNKPTPGQIDTINHLTKLGIQSDVCRSLADVFCAVNTAGFRLTENATYVLRELEARYAALLDAAPKPKRAGKARALPPSQGKLKAVARIRASGIRI